MTYALVPIFLAWWASMLPAGYLGLLVGSVPLIASGYGFAQVNAKTKDHYFIGFPSYWNIVVLYLFILETPVWVNVAVLLFLSVLVFVPVRYIYPTRTPVYQKSTLVLCSIWGVLILVLCAQLPHASKNLAYLSLLYPLQYTVLSFYLHFRRKRKRSAK